MAQYKVPQDVEADDKLLGPFTFRQFLYLMGAGALIAACIPLWNVFPALILIPLPFIGFFLLLALPLKRDQPMETYLSAIIAYHLKPNKRFWEPGEPESTIIITAPKKTDEVHLKNISQEEASHRLSFLADIVDTEGYAIKGENTSGIRAEVYAEANAVADIFDAPNPTFQALQQNNNTYRNEIVDQMRNAIAKNNEEHSHSTIIGHNGSTPSQPQPEAFPSLQFEPPAPITNVPAETVSFPSLQFDTPEPEPDPTELPTDAAPIFSSDAPNIAITDPGAYQDPFADAAQPQAPALPQAPQYAQPISQPIQPANPFETPYTQAQMPITSNPDIVNLANNPDYSIETIAQQANRINNKPDSEVFVSLH